MMANIAWIWAWVWELANEWARVCVVASVNDGAKCKIFPCNKVWTESIQCTGTGGDFPAIWVCMCGNSTTIHSSIDSNIPNHRPFQQFIITCMHSAHLQFSLSLLLSLSEIIMYGELHSFSSCFSYYMHKYNNILYTMYNSRMYRLTNPQSTLYNLQHKWLYDTRNVYGAYPRPNL